MTRLVLLIFTFACCQYSLAQRFEIGPFVGGANYIGDVGNATYIKPGALVVGGIAKWNRSTRHSLRLSVLYGEINADDAKSNEIKRQQRGYSFTNHIAEGSLGIEFNFYEFDLTQPVKQNSPYLYTGITYFNTNHHLLSRDRPARGVLEPQGDNWDFSIPMVLGYKQTLTQQIIGAVEVGARYTFTDNIDGSNPEELIGDRRPRREFGNPNNNDWYVFSGVSLTFTFGRKPCYCHL